MRNRVIEHLKSLRDTACSRTIMKSELRDLLLDLPNEVEKLMNYTSCTSCGVLLDLSRLPFPASVKTNDLIDETKAAWNGNTWVPKAPCPVCTTPVLQPSEEL